MTTLIQRDRKYFVEYDYHGNYIPVNYKEIMYCINRNTLSRIISIQNLGWHYSSVEDYEFFIDAKQARKYFDELTFKPTMEF